MDIYDQVEDGERSALSLLGGFAFWCAFAGVMQWFVAPEYPFAAGYLVRAAVTAGLAPIGANRRKFRKPHHLERVATRATYGVGAYLLFTGGWTWWAGWAASHAVGSLSRSVYRGESAGKQGGNHGKA